jgi:hypothetical protein
MRSWHDNHSTFSWRGHFENLRDYIPEVRRRKFQGMILTSWSTSGSGNFEWEGPGRPLTFLPMRRRMPHAGLPIFTAAFAEAVDQDEPLDYENFVVRYAGENFGFPKTEARDFLKALLLTDQPPGEGVTLRQNHHEAKMAAGIMAGLIPLKGEGEFERYNLMVTLTEHYLRTLLVEEAAQKADFSVGRKRTSLVETIRKLIEVAEVHNSRFRKAYEGELYPDELQAEIDYRMKGLRELHARISRSGRTPAVRRRSPAAEPAVFA